jgi:hypothetical protein
LPNGGRNLPSYASFLVASLELNDENKAKDYMNKMGQHFTGPFQVFNRKII